MNKLANKEQTHVMHRAVLAAAVLSLSFGHCFGQGEIVLSTYGVNLSGFMRFSNTVTETWASDGFVAGLYWGTDAASVTNLALPLAPVDGPWTGVGPSLWGFVVGGDRTVGRPGIPTYFQLKAWSVGFDSWEAALASGDPSVLVSVLSQSPVAVATPSASSGPPVPGIPWGGTLANPLIVELVPVPEPSLWALGALAASLFLRRFRRDATPNKV
jgi:hypothetical protein